MKPGAPGSSALIQKVADARGDIFEKLGRKDPRSLWRRASFSDVKKAVILCCASRSGSSLLYALLKRIPSFYSLSGESVPYLKLNGFTGDAFLSDEIPEEAALDSKRLKGLERDFLSDLSVGGVAVDVFGDKKALESYIDEVMLRFLMQWPGVSFSVGDFRDRAAQAARFIRKSSKVFDKEGFYLELIRLLRDEHKPINPYYYDIPASLVKKKFGSLPVPSGPPCDRLTIEEPPFILLSPAQKAGPADLARKTLLLKSSADCYRMPFFEKLLPKADIRIIYLSRNPAASINGLRDGWRHQGFFSHNVENFSRLRIAGYSGRFKWASRWWKYDLPPGWQDYASRSLEEVCAFQWVAANKAVQQYLKRAGTSCCRVRYEDLIGGLRSRIEALRRVADFAGVKDDPVDCCGLERLPLVQATKAPRRYRWKKNLRKLSPVLEHLDVRRMSAGLGYHYDKMKEWL